MSAVERNHIDIDDVPALSEVVEQVTRTGTPVELRRRGKAVATGADYRQKNE